MLISIRQNVCTCNKPRMGTTFNLIKCFTVIKGDQSGIIESSPTCFNKRTAVACRVCVHEAY